VQWVYIDLDDDPERVLNRALILKAAGILDADLQPAERFVDNLVYPVSIS
jgi:hypothetical protein